MLTQSGYQDLFGESLIDSTSADLTISDSLILSYADPNSNLVTNADSKVVSEAKDSFVDVSDQVTWSSVGRAFTASLPQDIGISSEPTFTRMTLGYGSQGNAALQLVNANNGIYADAANEVAISCNSLGRAKFTTTELYPLVSGYDLGKSTDRWDTLYATAGNFTGALTATTLDTGQGANELYMMNQDVETDDAVTFASVSCDWLDTGQGQNELYPMDQSVLTTASVTFGSVTSTSAFRAGNGSSTVPSYSFTDSSNLGMYRKSANVLCFASSGSDIASIGSSGIFPGANVTYDLGSTSTQWNTLYVDSVISDTVTSASVDADGVLAGVSNTWDTTNNSANAPISDSAGIPDLVVIKASDTSRGGAVGIGTFKPEDVVIVDLKVDTLSGDNIYLGLVGRLISDGKTEFDPSSAPDMNDYNRCTWVSTSTNIAGSFTGSPYNTGISLVAGDNIRIVQTGNVTEFWYSDDNKVTWTNATNGAITDLTDDVYKIVAYDNATSLSSFKATIGDIQTGTGGLLASNVVIDNSLLMPSLSSNSVPYLDYSGVMKSVPLANNQVVVGTTGAPIALNIGELTELHQNQLGSEWDPLKVPDASLIEILEGGLTLDFPTSTSTRRGLGINYFSVNSQETQDTRRFGFKAVASTGGAIAVGFGLDSLSLSSASETDTGSYSYRSAGQLYMNGVSITTLSAYANGDVVDFEILSTSYFKIYVNGVEEYASTVAIVGTNERYYPMAMDTQTASSSHTVNLMQTFFGGHVDVISAQIGLLSWSGRAFATVFTSTGMTHEQQCNGSGASDFVTVALSNILRLFTVASGRYTYTGERSVYMKIHVDFAFSPATVGTTIPAGTTFAMKTKHNKFTAGTVDLHTGDAYSDPTSGWLTYSSTVIAFIEPSDIIYFRLVKALTAANKYYKPENYNVVISEM